MRWLAGLECALAAVVVLLVGAAPVAADPIGVDDQRISDVGGLGESVCDARGPVRVAYNPDQHEYLVVWFGDDTDRGLVDDEFEIQGQRLDAATGAEVGSFDFLISAMGGVGDPDDAASEPAVVYNEVENEYLVVWTGTEDDQGTVEGEYEIYVQRLDAATGDPVGTNDQRISAAGGIGAVNGYDAFLPAVAYDPERNRYLVVWAGGDPAGGQAVDEIEIFAQRLDGATGAELGDEFRVSEMGGLGDPLFDAGLPAVVYNPVHDEFLAAWHGDEAGAFQVDDEFEIFVQRIDAATGAELGDDQRVTFAGPNGDAGFHALNPDVAYDPVADRYLVVWHGDDDAPPRVEGENEIDGQLLAGADAALVGVPIRVSNMGTPGDPDYLAAGAAVVWGEVDGEFLVVWQGQSEPPGVGQTEIWLQRVDADGFERGIDDERLSALGPEGSPAYDAAGAAIAFNPRHDEALVAFVGDDDTPPLLDDEREVYVQRWIQPLLFADGFESGDAGRWSDVVP